MRGMSVHLLSLLREHSCRIAFRFVYIAEAHATDEWPISSGRCNGDRGAVNIARHSSDADRRRAAAEFAAAFGFDETTVVCDTIKDEFEHAYGACPLS